MSLERQVRGVALVYAGKTDRCGMAMLLGKPPYNRRADGVAVGSLILFFGLLVALPIASHVAPGHALAVFDSSYRAGSLVFGGGHVVLPLLQAEVVSALIIVGALPFRELLRFRAGFQAAPRGVRPPDVLTDGPLARGLDHRRGRGGEAAPITTPASRA
jgi:hypothetical protein